MSQRETAPDRLTLVEVHAAIDAFTEVDWLRLQKVATFFGRNRRLGSEDLLQMAFVRALDGSRRCPRGVEIIRFLAEVMRSIASDDLKARRRKPELQLVPKLEGDNADDFLEFDIPDGRPGTEDVIVSEQEAERIAKAILSLFEDDPIAQVIVEGDMEGMEAEELRVLTGLDATAYNSKRRLIRRRIDRAFPEGWTP